ncbi:MAG: Rieske (2Fe-2S) protein [Deltaproteobacteria bacterium]|nr:Rieske (2Fe-2S) protein [Deltaproteobacteria bacterium]
MSPTHESPCLDRREFFKKSIFVLGGLIVAGLAIPAGTYFLSPLWKKSDEEWIDLGDISQIQPGVPAKLDFVRRQKDGWEVSEGRSSVWIVTQDGNNFDVFDPRCTHLGCPYHWDSQKNQFLCPCHNGVFAIGGEVVSGPPPRALDQLPAKVVEGKLLIQTVPPKDRG